MNLLVVNRSGAGGVLSVLFAAALVVGAAATAWSSTAEVKSSASLAGDFGLDLTIDDTSAAFVQDDTPSAESRYRVRFYLRLTDLSMGSGDEFVHFVASDSSDTSHFEVLVRKLVGEVDPRIRLRAKTGGVWTYTGSVPIRSGWHAIEIDFSAETGGANDGFVDWWIDGSQQSGLNGLDNESSAIDYVRWGAVGGIDSGTSGAIQVDDFVSLRAGSKIGLIEVHGVGLYDSYNGKFYLRNSREGGNADLQFRYGPVSSSWEPIRGDWNGDGRKTVGLYDPLNAKFYLTNSNGGSADYSFRYGPAAAGWIPIAGDWDGDGVDSVGLYDPTAGKFFLKNAHSSGDADLSFRYGPTASTWIPIAGDWDGNQTDTIGLYSTSDGKFFLRNANSSGNADLSYRFGPIAAGWLPVAGDWNGNGNPGYQCPPGKICGYTVGLFDKVNGKIFLRNEHSSGPADFEFRFGPQNTSWELIGGFWLLP